jgi:hypothetical protein
MKRKEEPQLEELDAALQDWMAGIQYCTEALITESSAEHFPEEVRNYLGNKERGEHHARQDWMLLDKRLITEIESSKGERKQKLQRLHSALGHTRYLLADVTAAVAKIGKDEGRNHASQIHYLDLECCAAWKYLNTLLEEAKAAGGRS